MTMTGMCRIGVRGYELMKCVVGDELLLLCLFFFFQAEDGIRDLTVTGVQTCALPIFTVTPLREILARETRSWELGATMFLAFGALALALAAIGLYSVMAYNVAQRVQELGVRAALGAQRGDLVRLVVSDGLKLGTAGIVIGVVIALVGGQGPGPPLFEEAPPGPPGFGLVARPLP